jgi:hypothetical protein
VRDVTGCRSGGRVWLGYPGKLWFGTQTAFSTIVSWSRSALL